MTKTEKLNALLRELTDDGFDCIEFRYNMGWYGVFYECRCFGDEGEYLGNDYQEAFKTLVKLYG